MSKNRKHMIWNSIIGLLLAGVLTASYILGSDKRKGILCNKIDITVEDSLTTPYLQSETIRQYLSEDYGKLIGLQMDAIDLRKIESILNAKGGILKSEAYVTNDGSLSITVRQRKPIIRFQTDSYGFYCDRYGFLLPLRENFSCQALLIEGSIPIDLTDCCKGRPTDSADSLWLEDILKVAELINSNPIWKDKIAQIHHNESGELSIKPKDGQEIFLLGDMTDIQEKFEKMQIYYEMISPVREEGIYDVVDLRYTKQIVCRNKEQENKK